ncbi:hypothetical protein, partial [Paractinoplanes toevensis]|uniref:hypothetical protein n=1 Tax=Paractinoplanes toevensis TaxID=571911 RepID=UPI001BB33685
MLRIVELAVSAISALCTLWLVPLLVNIVSDANVWPITVFRQQPRTWAAVLSVLIFVGGAFLLPRLRRFLPDTVAAADPALLRRQFAEHVREQCDALVRQRPELQSPVRLLWTTTTGHPAARRGAVLTGEPEVTWAERPLSGDQDTLAAAVLDLRFRQMVILGEAGAGKSACAILLTRALADTDPVPLLIPATGWDPRAQEDFLAFVRAQVPPRFRTLVRPGAVLPILDGLDELPTDLHALALRRLRAYGGPLVVTCRGAEYDRAVATTGHFLSQAAVVEIQPVTAPDARTYLSNETVQPDRWDPVFAAMEAPPLSGVFASPLMVTVASIAYRAPRTDPAELLGLADRDAVEARLLDDFVAAAFEGHDPERAHRWLSTLAHQLDRAQSRTLRWGRLEPGLFIRDLFPWQFGLLALALVALFIAPLAMIFTVPPGLPTAPHPGLVLFAATIGLLFCCGLMRRWHRYGWPEAGLWIGYGCALGFLVTVLNVDRDRGLVVGLVAGLLLAALPRRAPWPPAGAGRHGFLAPREVPARRRYPVITAVLHGSAAFVLFAGSYWPFGMPAGAYRAGLIAAGVFGVGAGLVTGWLNWLLFRLTHLRLAVRGRLPVRLRPFLERAYRHGVLRRAGDAWQFRHAILLEHLARQVRRQMILADGVGWAHATLLVELGEIGKLRQLAARDVAAAYRLADWLRARDRPAEAMKVLRPHSTSDDLAALSLAELLLAEGAASEAVPILERLAGAGEWAADWRLAQLRMAEGGSAAVRAHAGAGDSAATWYLIDELAACGDLDEVARMTLQGCFRYDWFSVRHGMAVLIADRRIDDAESVLAAIRSHATYLARRAADDENAPGASADVAVISQFRAPADAAKSLARWSAARLTEVPAADGRIDELRRRPRTPDDDFAAVRCLAELQDGNGALALLERHRGTEAVDLVLAERLAGQARFDEALKLLGRHTKTEFSAAARLRAEVLVAAGRADDLAAFAARKDLYAAAGYVALLARADRVAEAVEFLAHRRNSGAAALFADLTLRDRQRLEDVRAEAETGGWLDARRLAELLDRAEREAAEIRSTGEPCRRALLLALSGRLDEAVL